MLLEDLRNTIDFKLRQIFTFSRKNYCIINECKNELLLTEESKNREYELFIKYDLDYLKNNSTKQNYLENLYLLDLLDKYFELEYEQSASVLDIGCKNWFYVQGEFAFFNKFVADLTLDGIELDTNRLYTNFYSRKETAKAYMKGLYNVSYVEGDFLKHKVVEFESRHSKPDDVGLVNPTNFANQSQALIKPLVKKYDYMIWILPFVLERPHRKWGLPMSYFKPKEMLTHAYELLNDSGKIFIVNQGVEEYKAQKMLCDDLKIHYSDIGLIHSDFFDYKYDRYLIIINK